MNVIAVTGIPADLADIVLKAKWILILFLILFFAFIIFGIYYEYRLIRIKKMMENETGIRFTKNMDKHSILPNIPAIPGCYRIKNLKTKRVYIGQSKDLRRRLSEHLSGRGNQFVHKAYLGGAMMEWKGIALQGSGYKTLDGMERDLIAAYDAKRKGYNSQKGNYR